MFTDGAMLTKTGMETNEDAVGLSARHLFVIDGATGLSGQNIMGEGSDARWFAQRTAQQLKQRLDEPRPISDIVMDSMRQLCRDWQGTAAEMPSAGIAIWRQTGGTLEYFGLGDCSASLLLKDGSVRIWRETRLAALDQSALEQMKTLCRATGCAMPEARKRLNEVLIQNRTLRNTPEGYWCLDPSGVGIPHGRSASLPLERCSSVFACTDGYEQLIAFGYAGTLAQLHALTAQKGPEALTRLLFQAQDADAALTRVARFKIHDDASAAVAACSADRGE